MKRKSEIDYAYKFEYAFDNVYGHAFSLLKKFNFPKNGVHLDMGCGWGAISEKINELGLHYVGMDADPDATEHLRSIGRESHTFQFGLFKANIEAIETVLQGRPLASITVLDTLEHVLYYEELIKTISALSHKYGAPVVISVPNFAHDDVAFKLLCNRLDETSSGLLDETHINLFTAEKLLHTCKKNGLHQLAEKDVLLEKSDQYFPRDLLSLADASSLRQLLLNLRAGMNANGKVNQIVRLFVASHPSVLPAPESKRPFLTIVTRTTGDRAQELKEVLLCLTGQENTDFEVLIVGHNLTLDNQIKVENVIQSTPDWIRAKIRLIRINGGNRSAPLNAGFQEAQGEYISILDDDDIVFSNWIEQFYSLSKKNYGKILKSVSVRQEFEPVQTEYGSKASMAISSFHRDYPAEFDYLTMLHHNQCPGLCLAFPRSVYHDFGLRFDETINTVEDWDFILRATFICGVASSPVVTNIYRWWAKGNSSQTLHDSQEWTENYRHVQNKINQSYLILPPGNAKRISAMVDALSHGGPVSHPAQSEPQEMLWAKRDIAHQILSSDSWAVTKPLRIIKKWMGERTEVPNIFQSSEKELDDFIHHAQNSKSWRLTRFFRKS
ncbi:methyltransferase domain-containing protein [Paenibacillus sp. B01]|uniref:methyltransferase domain-containing protein n=1 Tax=Paenibacillus sp. B01 TaxID=2660554 RepID=UPI00129C0EB2|nr:methyltransferase domain-containing protein [Paenibacillus sp. B01]QGG58187.1 methyltransferase domain-containing protein [Paenibacillus sp. B01]